MTRRAGQPELNSETPSRLPWQLWVVTIYLGVEGLGNLLSIPNQPQAAWWLAAKCLFVIGFFRRWRLVFIGFLIVGVMHTLGFSSTRPVVAIINLVLTLLAASTWSRFFPPRDRDSLPSSPGRRESYPPLPR